MDSKETYIKAAFEKIIPLFRESGLPIDEIDERLQIKFDDIKEKILINGQNAIDMTIINL